MDLFQEMPGILQRLDAEQAQEHLDLLAERLSLDELRRVSEEALHLGHAPHLLRCFGLDYIDPDPKKLKIAAYLVLYHYTDYENNAEENIK